MADDPSAPDSGELDIEKISAAVGDLEKRLNGVSKETALIGKYAEAWARQSKNTSVNTGQTLSLLGKAGQILSKLNVGNTLSFERTRLKTEKSDLNRAKLDPDNQSRDKQRMINDALKQIRLEIRNIDEQMAGFGRKSMPQIAGMIRVFNKLTDAVSRFKSSISVDFLRAVYGITVQYGQKLIEANSSLEHRNRLLKTGLNAQIATGVELNTIAAIQNALIANGFDTVDNYEEMVKTAAVLHKGLGMSVHETSRLGQTARSARSPFNDLASTMARIVDDTAVAADRAGKIANELARAALGSRGINVTNLQALDQATSVTAQIEGFLKGTVADAEAITGLLSQFTKFSQKGGIGMMLGTGGTDFLTGPQAGTNIKRTLKSLNDFVTTVGTSGPALESLEEMLGVNRETLFEFTRAVREHNILSQKATDSQVSLINAERRYQRQMRDQGEVFSTLGRQLRMLFADTLTPAIMVLRAVSDGLSFLMSRFDGLRRVISPIVGIMGGVVLFEAARRLWSLTTAVVTLGTAAARATIALAAQTAATNRAMIGGSMKGAGAWLTNLGPMIGRGLARVPFGGIVSRMLGGLLRTVAIPILTRILPLLAGFLPGLIIGAIIMLWPYIKKLFDSDKKHVVNKQSQSDMAIDLSMLINRALKEDRFDALEFFAKNVTLQEARKAGLTEQQLNEVISEAVDRSFTQIRVVGAQAQLNLVDRAQAEESVRLQNAMIENLKGVAAIMQGLRDDNKTATREEAKKKAAEEDTARAKQAADAAMFGGMAAVNSATMNYAYGMPGLR